MKVAIVGCGKMGSAIAKALIPHCDVLAIRRNPEKLELKCEKSSDIKRCREADVIIITLKPDVFRSSMREKIGKVAENRPVISFMAGVSLKELKDVSENVVKAMAPLSVESKKGVITYCSEGRADKIERAIEVLEKLGKPLEVEENVVDASIAFASSVAFVVKLIEAAKIAGIRLGINAEISRELAICSFEGALELYRKYGCEEVVDMICTPAGATVEGLTKLMECGGEWCLEEAIFSAGNRFLK